MPHSVSPGFTVCESGALGARSDNATPACATRLAVSRISGVTGRRLAWAWAGAAATRLQRATAVPKTSGANQTLAPGNGPTLRGF